MDAVILAAGLGSRLKGIIEKPKGFLKPRNLGESLIQRSLRLLFEAGIQRIYIGAGHLAQHYHALSSQTKNLTIIENPHYQNTGSAQTLEMFRGILKNDFLLLESDLLYEKSALEILLGDLRADLVLASDFTYSSDEVYLEISDGKLCNLSKDKNALKHIDAELSGLSKISLATFETLLLDTKDYEYALKGFPVCIAEFLWCEIDDLSHLERAESQIIPKILSKEKN
ncbi:NTP transferase domain-containing protein [Helicobacter sp. 11S02596-1]|uniref:NTP transferase domain-containing protein n=1 Tax=Helicobacter sp. 11S02596-1 TaxID=1476194 RepID=UPI000BA753DE|nr:NTP transferase domain-containing protein [Helicobacter sp. 11S02596-1]PAF41424.1 hypothetical protein BJI48_08680 [Helicobacter sp. 11S02596-1]